MTWQPEGTDGREQLSVAPPFIRAHVLLGADGKWFASVNDYLMSSRRYDTKEEAKAAVQRYLLRKLKQALAEMETC